jgi:hypothetical protein
MFRSIPSILALLILSSAGALAQRVYWEPNAGSLAFGQSSPLQLVFENCQPEDDPKPPSSEGLGLLFTGTASSFAYENGNVTRKHLYNFDASPTRRADVQIPAFDIATDKGVQHVAPAAFTVGNATVGRTAIPLDTAAKGSLKPAEGEFWAGEVFPVSYSLDVAKRFNPRAQGSVVWKPTPVSVEDWSQPEQFSTTTGGEARVGLSYKSRGYVATPGSYHIPAASQEIVLVLGTNGSLLFQFSAPEMVKHTVISNEPTLTIKPLPDGAPADFGGAVGQFELTSKVVPTAVSVGEPVTWTLTLSGTGNWPDVHGLPSREVSKDFKVLQPQAKRTPSEGKLFDATLTEDVVLIPTKPGTYTLGPVSYSYFDPGTGAYRTVKTDRTTITINPPGSAAPSAQALFIPPSSPSSPIAASTAGPNKPHLEAPPAAPAAIPRDPLPGKGSGPAPFRTLFFVLWFLASVLWLIPAWLILAALRARRTDPMLARREARERLSQILAAMTTASSDKARNAAIHAWQRETTTLLDIAHAAPSSAMLGRSSRDANDEPVQRAENSHWERLWAETERALYGNGCRIPDDWLVRAGAALESTHVPDWRLSSLFQPENLFPWFNGNSRGIRRQPVGKVLLSLVVLLCLFAVAPRTLAAPEDSVQDSATAARPLDNVVNPRAAYDGGDFPAAERGWRAAIVRDPTDWVARHNLGLALAQQDHWPEAAAQWTSAFLLNPRQESVRWHLALGYERAAYTPPGLGEFAVASGPHLLSRLASPAEWQWLLVGAGLVFGGGLLLLLLRAYHTATGRWTRRATVAAMATAIVLALSAMMSLHFYGVAANPRAAIAWHQILLRSVPTEADTQQKTSSLPAGSLGVVNKEFLGWARLVFDNGQTGWVRQQDIVWLYR